MIGRTISHYRILEKVGEGGMGVVYKARDTKLNREVALKFLAPHALGTDRERARFRHEAQAAAVLDHPAVCPVYEIDEHEGQLFIAMALIEGQDLRKRIASGPLKIDDVLSLALQIAEGLQAAHAKEIIHRDIKPGNIMITADGRARIMDFGLAKSSAATRVTRAGTTTGTIAYMSPEQTQGQGVDQRTDVWSFGAMLYEMVTGQRPFKGDYEQAVVHSILSEEPEPMTGLRTGVPLELERIVSKAMAKRPDERYQAMGELLADLRALKRRLDSGAEVPTTAPVAAAVPPGAHAPQRQFRPAYLAGLVAVAVLLACVLAITFGLRPFGRGAPPLDSATVVVAIFENRTGDATLDPVGQMAADWIAEGLASTDLVSVVPTMTTLEAMSMGGRSATGAQDAGRLRELCERTGAGMLIAGAYYLQAENLQFSARVTDVASGELIRAMPTASAPISAPTEALATLRQNVMGTVAAYLGPFELVKSSHIPSFEAYQQFAAGMERFGRDYPEAIRRFERASELDSLFMLPRVFALYSYANLGRYAMADSLLLHLQAARGLLSENERLFLDQIDANLRGDYAAALRLLRQLEKRDPTHRAANYLVGLMAARLNRPREVIDTYARYSRGEHEARYGWTWWRFSVLARAHHLLGDHQKELETARQGQVRYPDVVSLRASEMRALAALGQVEELLTCVEDCITMARESWSAGDIFIVAAAYLRANGYLEDSGVLAARAVEWHRSRPPAEKDSESVRRGLADALYLSERWAEAGRVYEALAAARPDEIDYQGALGCAAARLGDLERAHQISVELQHCQRAYLFGDHLYQCACIASLCGDREQAVSLLSEAIAEGFSDYIRLRHDMDLEPLRDFPPFQELIRPKG